MYSTQELDTPDRMLKLQEKVRQLRERAMFVGLSIWSSPDSPMSFLNGLV
jgi:hypothetical protein